MSKLSERRAQAIFSAVHEVVVNLRTELLQKGYDAKLDAKIAQAGAAAAAAAVRAARGYDD